MALVTTPTIMPRLSAYTVTIPIIPMIARLTASMDRNGSRTACSLEPGRGSMGSGAAIGVEVITGEADIMDVAITDEEATTAGVSQPADVAALTADAVASAAVDAVGSAADVVEVDSTAAVVVPMAVAMVGATGN